jgi:hypothetical protein
MIYKVYGFIYMHHGDARSTPILHVRIASHKIRTTLLQRRADIFLRGKVATKQSLVVDAMKLQPDLSLVVDAHFISPLMLLFFGDERCQFSPWSFGLVCVARCCPH